MAQAGSKPYFISFTLPDGSRMRERVRNFEHERELLRDYEDAYGRPVTLRGRTYARSVSRKPKVNPPSGWIPATAVKITKQRNGGVKVQIRKRR